MRASLLGCAWGVAALTLSSGCVSFRHHTVGPFRIDHPRIQTIALAPLVNFSSTKDAGELVTTEMATLLRQRDDVRIVEATDEATQIAGRTIDRSHAQKLGQDLKVDAVLFGSVLEFEYVAGAPRASSTVPSVSVSARLVSTRTGSILWAASVAGAFSQVWTYEAIPIGELAQRVAAVLVDDLDPHLGVHRGQPIQYDELDNPPPSPRQEAEL